ncbi:hypothetical protein C8Q78DRAFT_1076741 [Trametes maxima]|nr:hypothetical protein C8Q78DRAFT_1076741 [Trametes maxima]
MAQPPKTPQNPEQNHPEFKFRTKPVQERSIFESYAALPARTRLYVSLGITAFAGIGLLVSDKLEAVFPPAQTAQAPRSPPVPSTSS